MNTDPIPVWQFFQIPHNSIEICHELSKIHADSINEKRYWQRAAEFLDKVRSQTTDQLIERDFDWMLQLRLHFEKDEIVLEIRSSLAK